MILLTVGTQLPFDRLVEIVDRLAPTLSERVFAQIGHGHYRPTNMEYRPFVGPIDFERQIAECSFLISHAGIGTLVMAQKHRKSIILFPRRAALDEHRNDHQLATVRALHSRPGVRIAYEERDLIQLVAAPLPLPDPVNRSSNRERLCSAIADVITAERRRQTGI